jgi:hypothetical protein
MARSLPGRSLCGIVGLVDCTAIHGERACHRAEADRRGGLNRLGFLDTAGSFKPRWRAEGKESNELPFLPIGKRFGPPYRTLRAGAAHNVTRLTREASRVLNRVGSLPCVAA